MMKKFWEIKNQVEKEVVEILIYGDRQIALISFQEEIGLIVESPKIQHGLRSMFETIWALAPGAEIR